MPKAKRAVLWAASICVAAAPAAAQEESSVSQAGNMDWVTISGTISAANADTFELDYGQGEVLVEVDPGRSDDRWRPTVGEKVRVEGGIDDQLYERRSIEAGAVYVDDERAYYRPSPADEPNRRYAKPVPDYTRDGQWVAFTGEVVSTSPEGLTVDTGRHQLAVDTAKLPYEVKLIPGDRVSVYGQGGDYFDGGAFVAGSVRLLSGS